MRWSGLVTLLTCCLVAAGCATTITGSAVPAPGGTSTNSATPACAGGSMIQPKNAPYCFELPAGFIDITDNVTLQYQSANPGRYVSAIDIARLDTITVSIYPLRADSDPLPVDFLATQIQHALPNPATTGITAGQPDTTTTLDGARTVRISVNKPGSYSSTVYFAFRGYTELELDCQWAQHQTDVDRGCAAVRDTLHFVDQHH